MLLTKFVWLKIQNRKCIRYNWLVCPTGKAGKYRGADWVLERNNLYSKVSELRMLREEEITLTFIRLGKAATFRTTRSVTS